MRASIYAVGMAVAVLLLAGCNAINRTQFAVTGSGASDGVRAVVSPVDRAAVKTFLKPIASQMKLLDLTATAPMPNLVVFYQEPGVDNPIKLFAWTRGDSIIIDLMQGPGTTGETLAYQRAKERLMTDVRLAFPDRVKIVPFPQVLQPGGETPR